MSKKKQHQDENTDEFSDYELTHNFERFVEYVDKTWKATRRAAIVFYAAGIIVIANIWHPISWIINSYSTHAGARGSWIAILIIGIGITLAFFLYGLMFLAFGNQSIETYREFMKQAKEFYAEFYSDKSKDSEDEEEQKTDDSQYTQLELDWDTYGPKD